MRDTKIVFMGIAVLLLLPLLFYGVRCMIRIRKEKDSKSLYYSLIATVLGCVAIIALFLNVYSFTISYQAPLVAEQFLIDEGYTHQYSTYLSENIYENDDGTITIYAQFESGDGNIYTIINLERQGDKWQVIEHEFLNEDDEENPELKKRFYPI